MSEGAEAGFRDTWAEVDLDALRANFRALVASQRPEVKVIASVKADAYGAGAVPVSRVLADEGVFALATGSVRDALEIREAGVAVPILMFAGFSAQAIPTLLDNELTPTVHNAAVAQAVSDAAREPTNVYVKIDCGLRRLGVDDEEAESFVKWVAALPNLVVEGLYTHVPFQTVSGRERTRPALRRFEELVERLREDGLPVPITQAAASSTLLAGMEDGCSAICPGHLLYGVLPFDESCGPIAPYRPVVTALKTRLLHIGSSATGERIEGSYRFAGEPDGERPHRWGVVPLGLGDGYRQPTPASEVLVRGARTSVLGVGLEHTIIDLTDAEAELGDTVVFLGDAGPDSISLAELAGGLGAAPLELLVGLSGRVDRVLIGEGAPR